MIRRRFPRAVDDKGAILIIAMIIVTVVAVVTGVVLTRGDGSLRATIALREVAGTAYAADGAAKIAINNLRTGYRADDPNDAAYPHWAFNNVALGPGCFGLDPDNGEPLNTLELPAFYPATGRHSVPTSAAVACEAEDATGAQGSPVPVTNANKPGHAILTLGQNPSEIGIDIKPQSSDVHEFRVHGGIWSNSNIVASNGPLQSTTSIRAHSGCTPAGWMDAPLVDCAAGIVPDPETIEPAKYAHDATSGVPTWRKAPTTAACDGVVEFEPGYYDDARALTAVTDSTVNACKNDTFWFKPGTYYFDFHNNPADPLHDPDLVTTSSSGSEWVVGEGNLVAGTPDGNVANPQYPGSCINPIDNVDNHGVQFIFGGDSRLKVDDGANVEICGTYHANRPPIAVYGLKSGVATPTTFSGTSALTGTSVTVSPNGTFRNGTNAVTAANLADAGNGSATWARTTSSNPSTSTITLGGINTATPIPAGSVLTGATLQVRHRETTATGTAGTASTMRITPTGGTALAPVPLTARATLQNDSVNLATNAAWSAQYTALQKAVHSGFTGASVDFIGNPKNGETTELDFVRLELTYYVPQLRAQTNLGFGATNCIATLNSCAVISTPTNYKDSFYIQGTTYVPVSRIDINLNQATAQVMRFGLIARSLAARTTGGYEYDGPVIELPDNSPGWGTGGTIVQLTVYLCEAQPTCDTSGGAALKVRVQLWDPSGTPEPPDREVTVLSWSQLN